MQCLKVFGDTHEVKNLYNACKYATAFPLVYAGYLRRHEPSSFHDQLFVVAAVVQSTYCLIWDVRGTMFPSFNDRTPSAWAREFVQLTRPSCVS